MPGLIHTASVIDLSAGFAAPDILAHASFETNTSESGKFYDGASPSNPPDWTRDGTHASLGSWSASRPVLVLPNGGGDAGGRQNWVSLRQTLGASNLDRIFVRFKFYSTCIVDSSLKWLRFFDDGAFNNLGGWEFNDFIHCWTDRENIGAGSYVVNTGADCSTLLNRWVGYEFDYWRNGDPSGWPSMQYWIDGVLTGKPDGPVGGSAPPSNAYWLNKRYYAGERQSSVQLGQILFLGTLTEGNTTSGTQWIDDISISTRRIG